MFGKTGIKVSEISLGTWQLGSKWGDPVNSEVAHQTLSTALSAGINCFDTADVYQGGLSEKLIGEHIQNLVEKPFVITKVGRKLPKQSKELYTEEVLPNETLAEIAERHALTVDDILKVNPGLKANQKLKPFTSIKIPNKQY